MKAALGLILALATIPRPTIASDRPPGITAAEDTVIGSFIASQEIVRDKDSPSLNRLEHRPARQYLVGTPDKDYPAVLAVRYTLEEANNWTLYVVTFEKAGMRLLAHGRVGGKGQRNVDLVSATGRDLELKAQFYSAYDALCCPTVPGRLTYLISNEALEEVEARIDCHEWRPPDRARKR